MELKRGGFTLVEVMVASSLSLMAMTAVGAAFLGVTRMVREGYRRAEVSLALRAERERLLFRTVSEGGAVAWGGLLSAHTTEMESGAVKYEAAGVNLDSGAQLTRENQRLSHAGILAPRFDEDGIYYFNLEQSSGAETATLRVAVPVFGVEQKVNTASALHYNLVP